ncbi:hypothetical protein ACFFF5_01790 [Lederbergia wuyishanensis]|uniref:Signal transduction histidine kinase n=1 Tax=Lederbergia wuyishanensis TaxID=1347903 RepID=A0ABU0D111_9BACI|nr:hypothetical protein [Lederbergia wuyishanensis]MCJ8006687.1 hypothetical protein [Lederbergia wuyishanensis]MDQ0342069.1 signal transduction histidine kinase [Lederbergia wuyishanensis]
MSGMISLLILWATWIYSTFIMDKKSKNRWPLAMFTLLFIIIKPMTFRFYSLHITMPSLLILVICYFLASRLPMKKQLHLIFSVFTLMIGYTGFLLFEMYDPIWMFIDRVALISFLLFILSYFLYSSSVLMRVLLVCLGTLQGDIIFALYLSKWNMPYIIGSMGYLDIISITVFSIIFINFISNITAITRMKGNKKISH